MGRETQLPRHIHIDIDIGIGIGMGGWMVDGPVFLLPPRATTPSAHPALHQCHPLTLPQHQLPRPHRAAQIYTITTTTITTTTTIIIIIIRRRCSSCCCSCCAAEDGRRPSEGLRLGAVRDVVQIRQRPRPF